MTRIAVIDVETDRFEGDEGEAKVIELACVVLTDEWGEDEPGDCSWEEEYSSQWLFGGGPITPRARAVHHISDVDIAERIPFDKEWWDSVVAADEPTYYAAHNAAFDRTVIERAVGDTERPWICTLKCARVAWPDAPAFGNQVLRYWREIERAVEPASLYPHCALYDATVTSWLLADLIAEFNGDLERMVQVSSEPTLLYRCTLPKHRGVLWRDVPKDYLRWILSKDFDEDTAHTARYWLERQ